MKKTIKRVLYFLLGIILLGLVGMLIYSMKLVNIIPNKYFILGTILLSVIVLIIELFLLIDFKKTWLKIIKGIMIFLAFLLCFGCIFGLNYLNKTLNFFENIKIIKEEVTDYYVIVKKDTKYQEVSDLYGTKMAHFINTDEEVLDSLKLELIYSEINSTDELIKALYEDKVDSILISDIVKDTFEDEDEEFNDKIRILKTISIKKEIEDISKRVSMKNTPFNILISGIDTYGAINTVSRNDVNIIASVNPNTNQILLIHIPRDFYVRLHGKTGNKDKLSHANYYGYNVVVQSIEDLFGIDINYYVKVNFTTYIDLINNIGGITVYADKNLYREGCNIHKGYNKLNGFCALQFARIRKQYSDGDRHRGRNQEQVIEAIFKKLTSGSTLLTQYTDILSALDGKFATNMDINELTNYVKYELDDFKNYKITSIQVDGSGAYYPTYSYPKQLLWVMIPYQNTIDTAKDKINKVFNGEEL